MRGETMEAGFAAATFCAIVAALAVWMVMRVSRELDEANLALARMMRERAEMNGHAWKLGRWCEVLDYRTGRWCECAVVAVSHKGGLCVRRPGALEGFWVKKENAEERVRWK